MNTETLLLIGQLLLKYGPNVARQVTALFQKQNPTAADWDNVFALAEKPYEEYVAPKA